MFNSRRPNGRVSVDKSKRANSKKKTETVKGKPEENKEEMIDKIKRKEFLDELGFEQVLPEHSYFALNPTSKNIVDSFLCNSLNYVDEFKDFTPLFTGDLNPNSYSDYIESSKNYKGPNDLVSDDYNGIINLSPKK